MEGCHIKTIGGGTNVLHKSHIARGFLLHRRCRWELCIGKGLLLASQFKARATMEAMCSITQRLWDRMWSYLQVHKPLWHENRFQQVEQFVLKARPLNLLMVSIIMHIVDLWCNCHSLQVSNDQRWEWITKTLVHYMVNLKKRSRHWRGQQSRWARL